jgi:hypothetical protein
VRDELDRLRQAKRALRREEEESPPFEPTLSPEAERAEAEVRKRLREQELEVQARLGTEDPDRWTARRVLREHPELMLAFVALAPLTFPAYAIWRLTRGEEADHDSLLFRYHDFAARNPEAGLAIFVACMLSPVLGAAVALLWYQGTLPNMF